jgi:hypothetical protein
MKPLKHATNSARKYGGVPEDYQAIHDFMDHTKQNIPDMRHRMILHNSWGCYLAEKVFGTYLVNNEGRKVSVRDVAEQHVLEDLGYIPTLEKCFKSMKLEKWMGGKVSISKRNFTLID